MSTAAQIQELVERADQVYASGDPVGALAILDGIEFDEGAKADNIYGRYLAVLGSAQAESGQLEAAASTFNEALKFHGSRGEQEGLGLAYLNLGNVSRYASHTDDAERYYRQAIEHYASRQHGPMLAMAWLQLGNLVSAEGNWQVARESLSEIAKCFPDGVSLPHSLLWSKLTLEAKLAVVDGDDASAVALLRKAVEASAASGDQTYQAESLTSFAEVLARNGEIEEARSCLTKALHICGLVTGAHADQLRRQTRAALMKVNNLDFAFGHRSTLPEGVTGDLSRDGIETPATPSSHRAPPPDPAPQPLWGRLEGARANKEKVLTALEEAAGTGHCICVFSLQDAFVCMAPINTNVVIDAMDATTWSGLEEHLHEPEALKALEPLSPVLCGLGVELKGREDAAAAASHYALALRLTLDCRQIEGLAAVSGNILTLDKQMKAATGGGQLGHDPGLTMTAGDVILAGKPASEDDGSERLLAVCRDEAQRALTVIEGETTWPAQGEVSEERLHLLQALRRLRALVGRRSEPEWLLELGRLSKVDLFFDRALESIYEELAEANFLDILVYLGRIDEAGLRDDDRKGAAVFANAWESYLACRPGIGDTPSPNILGGASMALASFADIRSRAVAAGAAFGHQMSYETAQFPARLSRDLIRILAHGDREHQLHALALSEQSCARALVDWMARTHPSNRLMIRAGHMGSVGEVMTASLGEIFAVSAQTNTAILYFVSVVDGYVLWAIQPNGDWDSFKLPDLGSELLQLFESLPYTFDVPDFSATRPASPGTKDTEKPGDLDRLLLDLGKQLIPDEVRRKLTAESVTRIAVVADQMMQFVSFSALRWTQSEYVLDHFDVVYWPSVTAFLLCASAESVYSMDGQGASNSIVIGGPDFSEPLRVIYRNLQQQIEFEDLPGARDEAMTVSEILGVKPILGPDATVRGVMSAYAAGRQATSGRGACSVLHLATHGLSDVWEPNQSFLAFADGVLTAEYLYTFDAGIRTRLTMLSCCQTAVGYTHPDSILGLANAFLITGACTVGSTLWNIGDESTSILMTRFYTELKAGRDVAAAMRAAQLELRSEPTWSHPSNWASFKITGSFTCPYASMEVRSQDPAT